MQDGTAYDDLPDGVLVADDSGRVTVLNPAAARLLGVSAGTAVGRDLREVLPLADEQGRDWWTCTDPWGGLPSRARQPERKLTLPSGRALLVTASYVRGADRRLVRLVVVLRDDRARERLDRSRADLVSTVAHELRSPLTSVKGFTATLLARWDRFSDEQKKVMLQTVNADADKVEQVVANLVENALRHGDGTVTVAVRPADGGTEVVVADEGPGIPDEVVSRVFTRFWRGSRRGGTGLGLYIVKGLVEAHGGTVSVGRSPSGGASFRFLLPAGAPPYEV